MKPIRTCHVVALPYPGRGHVNPMMTICKQLCAKKPDILVTFVVTEEWLGLIRPLDPAHNPGNLAFSALPNVIPSEHGRADDFPGFVEAVNTKLEGPFEELLDRLDPKPSVILADTYVRWVVGVGSRRKVPVASLWTMSASVFSVFHHLHLLKLNGHFPANLSERGQEVVNYVPGVPSTRLADLATFFSGDGLKTLPIAEEAISNVAKAQYLLFTSVYELESPVFDALKLEFPFPVYPIGPSIPHFLLEAPTISPTPNYFRWLDSQPERSVLYVSLGSFLSVSSDQLDEIVAGVKNSSVRYFWVARGDVSKIKDGCEIDGNTSDNNKGLVVPWCDQLRVLCHPSIGGFWTHCGWNSTLEGVYTGVPMLTFPIFWDQIPNSKRVVEDWKIGCRVRKEVFGCDRGESVTTRDEIAELVKRFMDLEDRGGIAMRERANELKKACRGAVAQGGSSAANFDAFVRDISRDY